MGTPGSQSQFVGAHLPSQLLPGPEIWSIICCVTPTCMIHVEYWSMFGYRKDSSEAEDQHVNKGPTNY